MKKLLLVIGFGFIVNSVSAIDSSFTFTNNAGIGATNLINGRAQVQLLSIVNNVGLANNFTIVDTPFFLNNNLGNTAGTNVLTNGSGLLGYSNAAYASIVQYTTNIRVFYTNSMGLTNFQPMNTNAGFTGSYTNNPVWASNVLWTATNTVGPITNLYRVLFSGTIGASATLTITNQFNCIYGLTYVVPGVASNTVNVTWSSGL